MSAPRSPRPLQPLLLASMAALGGCSLAPAYHEPPATPPPAQRYQDLGDWQPAQPADAQDRGPWWRMFGDDDLDALERRAADANQDIKAAFARLQQARADTRIARAAYWPAVSADAAATRTRGSANAAHAAPGEPLISNDFNLQADLSYELDFWGRIRNTAGAAAATQQASAADLAAMRLAIHAEVATDYFTLRGADTQQELIDRTVEEYGKALQLTQNLYDGGAAARSDVAQAEAQLETARTQAAEVRLQRDQAQHALAVLVGANPSVFRLEARPLSPSLAPPPIDAGLPSTLLQRRPDIAAAERRVAAANAGIGIARAAYFPVFSLAAVAGFDSAGAATWLNAPSRLWSLGANGALTLFDAGLHRAQSARARAVYDEQVAGYRNTVLTAYQEVEDNLAALNQLAREADSEARAVTATGKALEQAQYRYRAGAATYLEVVASESASLQARQAANTIQSRRLVAGVLLVKALGGGWTAGNPDE